MRRGREGEVRREEGVKVRRGGREGEEEGKGREGKGREGKEG